MSEITRDEALQHLRSEDGGLRAYMEKLSEAEATQPKRVGDWSAKQILSHIVAWEEEGAEWLRLIAEERGDEIRAIKRSEVDAWNAAAVARLGGITWAALLERWAAVRRQLIQAVQDLTEEQFSNPASRLRPARWLPDFAWTHEAEHARELSD